MAITNQSVKIAINADYLGQQWQMVQWYTPTGAAFLTADARGVGEAYWNDVKTALRATVPANSAIGGFRSIFVSEPGPNGAYGEFPIPTAEQVGTRSTAGLGDQMPPFVAVGVRLTVATRATRPGQKRFAFVNEVDSVNGVLQAPLAGCQIQWRDHFGCSGGDRCSHARDRPSGQHGPDGLS